MTKKELEKKRVEHKEIRQKEIQKVIDSRPTGIISNSCITIKSELWELFEKAFNAGYQKCFDDYSGIIISHGGVYVEYKPLKCEMCTSATSDETSDISDAVAKIRHISNSNQWYAVCEKCLEEQIKDNRPFTVEYLEERKGQ